MVHEGDHTVCERDTRSMVILYEGVMSGISHPTVTTIHAILALHSAKLDYTICYAHYIHYTTLHYTII